MPGINFIKVEPGGNDTGRYQIKWQEAPTLVTGVGIKGAVSGRAALYMSE